MGAALAPGVLSEMKVFGTIGLNIGFLCIFIVLVQNASAAEYSYGQLDSFHPQTPLPSASIRSIGFDAQGTAWFTIYSSGLARYTGEALRVFGPESGISSVAVRELAIDSDGFIWVGSDKGLSVSEFSTSSLSPNADLRFRTKIDAVQLEQKNILAGPFWHASTSRVYILTAHELIGYQWTSKTNVKEFRRGLDEFGTHGFQVGAERVWIFAGSRIRGTLDPFSNDTGDEIIDTPCARVSSTYRAERRQWVGCRNGDLFTRLHVGSGKWELRGNYGEIYYLSGHGSSVLVTMRSGVILINETGEIELFDQDTGLDNTEIRRATVSEHGGLWFAGTQGLTSLPADFRRLISLSSWRESESLVRLAKDNLVIRQTRTVPKSLVLGGTDIIWVESETLKRLGRLELEGSERAWLACEDTIDESLWVSTTSELLRIAKEPSSALGKLPREAIEVGGQTYWVERLEFGRGNGCATYSTSASSGICFSEPEEILCFDSKSGLRRFSAGDGLPKNSTQALAVDSTGYLWSGSFSSGLFRSSAPVGALAARDTTFRFDMTERYNLVSTNVESIIWSDGRMFLATDKGLVIYELNNPDPVLHLNEHNGLGDTYIYTMALDGDYIWVGGNKGARKVRIKDGELVEVLDRGNGLPDQEMPWHQAIAKLDDGRLGLATSSGFYFYDDAHSNKGNRIDDYPVEFWDVDVKYSRFREQNEIRFSFGVGPVDGFERVWYRYRVNGAGGTWSDPTLSPRGLLRNLPAFGVDSEFYLEIEASFDREIWSQALVRRQILVKPAYWFTWWGLAAEALLLLGFMFFIIRLRLNSERKRGDELSKLANALREANSEKERELLERRTIEGELSSIKEKAASLSRELRVTESARDHAAESLEKVERSLIQAEKLSTMGQMIAGVTHELVNPAASLKQSLNPITSHLKNIETTLDHLFDEGEPEAMDVKRGLGHEIDSVREAIVTSHKISNRILEYSTALKNHARYDSEAASMFRLKSAVDESILILRDRLKGVDVSIHFETDAQIEGWLGQMVQVFTNLLVNAVDACAAEGIEPKIRTSCRPGVRNGVQGVEVHVDDNGPGFRPGSEERIFEALFTTKPAGVGTGLGLATARQVIKRHEGAISATSGSILGGARFVIWLPLKLPKSIQE